MIHVQQSVQEAIQYCGQLFGKDFVDPQLEEVVLCALPKNPQQRFSSASQFADPGVTWNLGSGTGHSVLQVIRSVERIAGRPVPYQIAARRPGDPAVLVAASDRARAAGWRPQFEALDEIVRTAFAWREAHPSGYGG